MKLNLTSLSRAIRQLENALEYCNSDLAKSDPALAEHLRAAAIQAFEFTYELGIKMLKRQMEAEAASPSEIDHLHFRDMLRIAAEKGLITNVHVWFAYRELRNITAHTYDHEKAQIVYEGTLRFMIDARALLENLEVRNA